MAKMNCILKFKVQNPTKDTIRLPLSFRNNQSQIFVIFNYCNPTLTCAFPGTNVSKKLYVHFNDSSSPYKKKKKKKKKREERGRYSVLLLSILAFIHSPVKCNKSLYIFTHCIALLVYLITFELLKQSTINQKTKWYYNPLDNNFIKIHPFYKHFNINYPIFNRETWENWLI
jgi:hypothetical protein